MRFVRPPFGVTSPKYIKYISKSNVTPVGWTYRSFDTMLKIPKQLVDKTIEFTSVNKNAILLFHDTQSLTVEALPLILKEMKVNGTKIVNLSESINEQAYV